MSSNVEPMLLYIRERTVMMKIILVLEVVLKPLPGEDLWPLGPMLGTKICGCYGGFATLDQKSI